MSDPKKVTTEIVDLAKKLGDEVIILYADTEKMKEGLTDDAASLGVRASPKTILLALIWLEKEYPEAFAIFFRSKIGAVLKKQKERLKKLPDKNRDEFTDKLMKDLFKKLYKEGNPPDGNDTLH